MFVNILHCKVTRLFLTASCAWLPVHAMYMLPSLPQCTGGSKYVQKNTSLFDCGLCLPPAPGAYYCFRGLPYISAKDRMK